MTNSSTDRSRHLRGAADLQDAADAAAWRLLLRRKPDLAERIRLALQRGTRADEVLAAATERAPAMRVLLPCAVHGCALDLQRQRRSRPAWRPGFALLRALRRSA